MSDKEERRKSARQRRVRPTAHSSALESLRAAREGLESRAEQHDVRLSRERCEVVKTCCKIDSRELTRVANKGRSRTVHLRLMPL